MIYNVNNYYFIFMIRVSQRLVVTIMIMYNSDFLYTYYIIHIHIYGYIPVNFQEYKILYASKDHNLHFTNY